MAIRVLVVDDSAVVRRMLSKLLDECDSIEVIGTARNGEHAVAQVAELEPDLVTMDVEMPVCDGVEAVRRIRVDHPRLPILMFSSMTERGSRATIDSLVAGATGYVTKQSSGEGLRGIVQGQLGPRILEIAGRSRPPEDDLPTEPVPAAVVRRLARRPERPERAEALLIGCSTGGPNALAQVIPALPRLGVPVLVVQHMPPRFTALLAERLDGLSTLTVREGAEGMPVESDHVYIAPGGYHMRIRGRPGSAVIALDQEPPVNSCRPAVDCLFESAVAVYGGRLLGVILTGMGHDGRDGSRVVVEAGGTVLAQDEDSSVVWGMPRAVARAGLAEALFPLDEVADAITARLRGPRLLRRVVGGEP